MISATDGWPAISLIPGPVRGAWEEGTLTRVEELRALKAWAVQHPDDTGASPTTNGTSDVAETANAIDRHLYAAQQAAEQVGRWPRRHSSARLERAISNLDAAEAHLLRIAPPAYLLGQMPSILNHVQRHLGCADPRRLEIESLASRLGLLSAANPAPTVPRDDEGRALHNQEEVVRRARDLIVNAVRGASSAALREKARVRSFRDVVVAATIGMTVVTGGLIAVGIMSPTSIPLCFAPESSGTITVVCPTEQWGPEPVPADATNASVGRDIDDIMSATASKTDVPLIALVGATAAALAAASAIRNIRGSSEPYGVPIALALLKLPSGALTALLGLLLMRGGFVPGLSALDSSAQIVAWAILFGYAQQLFTRLVDQQAHTVLGGVRGTNRATEPQLSQ